MTTLKLSKEQQAVYNMVKSQIWWDSAMDWLLEDLYKSWVNDWKDEIIPKEFMDNFEDWETCVAFATTILKREGEMMTLERNTKSLSPDLHK